VLVGTNKRERQKRNRDSRRDQVTRRTQRVKVRKRGTQIAVVALIVVALVGFVFATGNNSDDTAITETEVDTTEVLADETVDETATENAVFEYGTTECPPTDASADQRREFADAHQLCIDPAKSYTANFDTTQGSFTVQLLPERAPGAVNNFVSLARWKYFDGTKCHRVIEDFVVQCGDPTATGSGGPGYSFADELPSAGEYTIGSLAMANSGPNTNGSQFFIITGVSGTSLPPNYTLFGQVTAGLDTAVAAMAALFNPDPAANGVPPAADIILNSVTISEA
jgi:peptidylprolyl isomerase/peptidyl-prolyl cis-trans isomerase B (cyclophilin B)